MTQNQDQFEHRNLDADDAPLDAANQSLTDALRSSFFVLKLLMALLVVLYLASNVRSIKGHEQAIVLRMGRLLPEVHDAGLMWAFPYPIDEIVPLPTMKSNDLLIDSHTFRRQQDEKGKELRFISRGTGEGLDPGHDGALLTADVGLVHVQWKVTYKFDDVASFVTGIKGDEVEAAESLLRILVETVGIEIASEMTAEEMIRTRVDDVRTEMMNKLNDRLVSLDSGIRVATVEMPELTPPLQIRSVFEATQRAENTKEQLRRNAEKDATNLLSRAAGAAYGRTIDLLQRIERGGDGRPLSELEAELDQMLANEVEGEAGKQIKRAGAYRAGVVSRMESDVEEYRALLPEYKRAPLMLINRIWQDARQEIFASPGVIKFYRPPGIREFRLRIPLDPEQRRLQERQRLEKEDGGVSDLKPESFKIYGPDFD